MSINVICGWLIIVNEIFKVVKDSSSIFLSKHVLLAGNLGFSNIKKKQQQPIYKWIGGQKKIAFFF